MDAGSITVSLGSIVAFTIAFSTIVISLSIATYRFGIKPKTDAVRVEAVERATMKTQLEGFEHWREAHVRDDDHSALYEKIDVITSTVHSMDVRLAKIETKVCSE